MVFPFIMIKDPFVPYFWDLITNTGQQEWDEFVEIRVSVFHLK